MFLANRKFIAFLFIIINFVNHGFSQERREDEKEATLQKGIQILEKYFGESNDWYVTNPKLGTEVNGLIHFIQDEPLDSIITGLKNTSVDTSFLYVYRLPENVSDSLQVPGYFSADRIEQEIEKIGVDLQNEYQDKELTVPMELLTNIEGKVEVFEPGEGMRLFKDSVYTFPDSLKMLDFIPDTLVQNDADFRRILYLDSLRNNYIEQKRLAYNDSVVKAYRDSVIAEYRQEEFEKEYNFKKQLLLDSVKLNNYRILKSYNDSVIVAVNDSINSIIQVLSQYADFIDTTQVRIVNLAGEESLVTMQNGNERYSRVWLKNEQKDSLGVLVKTIDKKSMQMLIDDGVSFTRFTPKKTKDFDFSTLNKNISGLTGVGNQYEVQTPWKLGGDGTVGFTQTYLENWKKGGQSALSLLIVLKASANYSSPNEKVKWENSGEIRDGWIRPGGEQSELQKNDDRFEFTSRFGVSAFKKWYYSAEFNYETQFFKGFKYPKASNPDPISAFMAPAKTFFKVGLDYKPNKDFSLLLSPLTLKNVYVRDTALIDQTKFGIPANQKSFWEPGLNADITFKRKVAEDISYETKYKMFINYKKPFSKFDINWENLLIMKLTDYINMRLMVHLIYDDDILFPVYDQNDVKIGEEPKLQIKQLITVGFSYTINRNIMRAKRIR